MNSNISYFENDVTFTWEVETDGWDTKREVTFRVSDDGTVTHGKISDGAKETLADVVRQERSKMEQTIQKTAGNLKVTVGFLIVAAVVQFWVGSVSLIEYFPYSLLVALGFTFPLTFSLIDNKNLLEPLKAIETSL